MTQSTEEVRKSAEALVKNIEAAILGRDREASRANYTDDARVVYVGSEESSWDGIDAWIDSRFSTAPPPGLMLEIAFKAVTLPWVCAEYEVGIQSGNGTTPIRSGVELYRVTPAFKIAEQRIFRIDMTQQTAGSK